jgi:hypothetical protein
MDLVPYSLNCVRGSRKRVLRKKPSYSGLLEY